MRRSVFGCLAAVSLGLVSESSALACAVCGGGGAPNEAAYYDMTIFMSLFPLGLIGIMAGAVYYFKLGDTTDVVRNGGTEAATGSRAVDSRA